MSEKKTKEKVVIEDPTGRLEQALAEERVLRRLVQELRHENTELVRENRQLKQRALLIVGARILTALVDAGLVDDEVHEHLVDEGSL